MKRERSAANDLGEKVYRNPTYGFGYKVPYGWVERTREMQGGATDSSESETPKTGASRSGAAKIEPGQGRVLLAVFERPPEATGETVNSAVVIAEEPTASYPGLKTAADYIGPVTELASSKGFKPAGDPYEFALGAKPLVRCDFSRELGKVSMHQSTLILLQGKSVVSFTFLAGNESDVDELVERLSFGSGSIGKK